MTLVIAQALASPAGVSVSADEIKRLSVSADEIKRAVVGKTCTTKAGAKFTFSRDGHYAYDGLWESRGHYRVRHGAVTVLLDSGIERSFALSRKGDIFYMEETAFLYCR